MCLFFMNRKVDKGGGGGYFSFGSNAYMINTMYLFYVKEKILCYIIMYPPPHRGPMIG